MKTGVVEGLPATGVTIGEVPAATSRRPALNALNLPCDLPYESWLGIGRQLRVVAECSVWWLGDWLVFGQTEFPGRYRVAVAETSLDYQTLRNYAWTARKIPPARRRAKLSFQHHTEVCALSVEEQDKWLLRAELLGWSRNELRRQIKQSRGQSSEPGRAHQLVLTVSAEQERLWRQAAELSETDLDTWMTEVIQRAVADALDSDEEPSD